MESFFTRRRISFEVRDIQKEHRFYREWHDHFHGDIVPLIVFDNGKQILDGYAPKRLQNILRELQIHPRKPAETGR